MITVEDVQNKYSKAEGEAAKNNEELLKTGSSSAVKKSYWPWILLAGGAILGLWYFVLRKNGNESNKGISG